MGHVSCPFQYILLDVYRTQTDIERNKFKYFQALNWTVILSWSRLNVPDAKNYVQGLLF